MNQKMNYLVLSPISLILHQLSIVGAKIQILWKITFLIYFAYCVGTVFENPQNVAFEFLQFPTIFALTKVACLVTLFNRKLQFFKNSSNVPFLMNFCPLK